MASNLNVTELDFDQIKDNLKNFLKQQSEFNDYDFEGSGLSVLLDVLAYNTHYNAIAAHYSLNESFLDSAQIRGNVTTRAKMLGYVPRSILSPKAIINFTVDASQFSGPKPEILTLPRGTKFTSEVQGEVYEFISTGSQDATRENNIYNFTNIEIAQGTYKTMLYRVDNDIESQKFQIPDIDADMTTLRVRVQQNERSSAYQVYNRFESLLGVNEESLVYYLEENTTGKYDVYFGDGVMGNKPANNNVITLDYIYTDGVVANGASAFSFSGSLRRTDGQYSGMAFNGDGITYSVESTTRNAAGGAERESIESIRFNAPLTFTAQNRAVTSEDYRSIILKSFPNISSISTWGGEDNNPPEFGKVFIAVNPLTEETLTEDEKAQIKDTILRGKSVVSIVPEIIDPNFTFLELDVFLKYNPNITDRTSIEIESLIADTISDYNFNNLNKFDGVFRYSQLLTLIDSADRSILNSIIRPYMFKYITAGTDPNKNGFELTFASPIFESGSSTDFTISSTSFLEDGVQKFFGDIPIEGSSNRQVVVYRVSDGENIITQADVGIIEPSQGKLTINNFKCDSETKIKISVTPNSLDIAPKRDQLLNISSPFVRVTAEIDSISTAGSSGSINYSTTPRLR
jgi:hypothetical protein